MHKMKLKRNPLPELVKRNGESGKAIGFPGDLAFSADYEGAVITVAREGGHPWELAFAGAVTSDCSLFAAGSGGSTMEAVARWLDRLSAPVEPEPVDDSEAFPRADGSASPNTAAALLLARWGDEGALNLVAALARAISDKQNPPESLPF